MSTSSSLNFCNRKRSRRGGPCIVQGIVKAKSFESNSFKDGPQVCACFPNSNYKCAHHGIFLWFPWFDIRLGGRYWLQCDGLLQKICEFGFANKSNQVVLADIAKPLYRNFWDWLFFLICKHCVSVFSVSQFICDLDLSFRRLQMTETNPQWHSDNALQDWITFWRLLVTQGWFRGLCLWKVTCCAWGRFTWSATTVLSDRILFLWQPPRVWKTVRTLDAQASFPACCHWWPSRNHFI